MRIRRLVAAAVLLLAAAVTPVATATSASAYPPYTYVWNDQNSYWPIQAKVDYWNGQISINPGTWSYWAPVTVPVVNYVYNGVGSCLKFWWLDNYGWHRWGSIYSQNTWIKVPSDHNSVGITAVPWDGVRTPC